MKYRKRNTKYGKPKTVTLDEGKKCPVCDRTYILDVSECLVDGAELEEVDEDSN